MRFRRRCRWSGPDCSERPACGTSLGGFGAGLLNGRNNIVVGAAAADVAAHGGADGVVVGGDGLVEERRGGHDLAGGAVAALESIVLEEGLLDGVELAVLREAFDGGDFAALVHDGEAEA